MSNKVESSRYASPYAKTLGAEWVRDVANTIADRKVLHMPFGDHLLGRPSFLHGGAITGMVELAAWFTLSDALADEPAAAFKPISVSIDFLRGGKMVETRATAKIIRLGRRLAILEARGWQEDEASPIVRGDLKFLITR
ncbi:MAG: PaaI family thioesterase [Sphingomonadales bacterium]|nr:PaaI family thioesterase [Sphingomonadales bacterium]